VQNWNFLGLTKLFCIEKVVNRVYGPWTIFSRGPRWTGGTELNRSSLELSPCGAMGHQSSPRRRGEGEGDVAELTEAKIGRRGGEVVSVAERNGTRRWCLVLSGSRHG
jgi:hypothetical protein